MNLHFFCRLLVCLLVCRMPSASLTSPHRVTTLPLSLDNGTVGGGGGGTILVDAIEYSDFHDIVRHSRAELYLFFLRQKSNLKSHLMSRLFTGSDTIFEIIEKYRITEGQNYYCYDSHGKKVDASIHSHIPQSICVSVMMISHTLPRDEARNQALSLIAHEYSHLLGFDEKDASLLQKEIFELLENDSKERVYDLWNDSKHILGMLRGAIINYQNNKSQSQDWNYLCFVADSIEDKIQDLKVTDRLKEFSLFDHQQRQTLETLRMKIRALNMASCGQSSYHPFQKELAFSYQKIFGSNLSLPAKIFSKFYTEDPVDPDVSFRRIQSPQDFNEEIKDIAPFVDQSFERAWLIQKLYDSRLVF